MVQHLVEQGADIHTRNDIALVWGDLPIVKFLVKAGADIHADDDMALRDHAINGKLSVVHYLVEQGANIHARNDGALRQSDACSEWSVVRYLQRVAFTAYMRNPELAYIMTASHAHYAALLRAFHRTMGRRGAMDVQHLVIEMLVGTSVMMHFRNCRLTTYV